MTPLKPLKIVIVGARQRFWRLGQEELARMFIDKIMEDYPDALFISGECPEGGVDIWVKEIAQYKNRKFKPYPPKKKGWYYYKKRNIQMAEAGDLIIDIEPVGHTGGGTWTLNFAKSIGKKTFGTVF